MVKDTYVRTARETVSDETFVIKRAARMFDEKWLVVEMELGYFVNDANVVESVVNFFPSGKE